MRLPEDYTPIERELYDLLVRGVEPPNHTVEVYKLLEDPMDKFLLAFVYDLGNTRKQAEIASGLSKRTIWKRLKRVKRIVGKHYGIL